MSGCLIDPVMFVSVPVNVNDRPFRGTGAVSGVVPGPRCSPAVQAPGQGSWSETAGLRFAFPRFQAVLGSALQQLSSLWRSSFPAFGIEKPRAAGGSRSTSRSGARACPSFFSHLFFNDGGSQTPDLLTSCWQNPGGSAPAPRCLSVLAVTC